MMTIASPITQKQIELIENSWDFILTNRQEAGFCFYKILFEIDPSLRRLFHVDQEIQTQKLISLVTFVIHKLDNISSVLADVRSLGMRHAGYQVEPAHYKTVEKALLKPFINHWESDGTRKQKTRGLLFMHYFPKP